MHRHSLHNAVFWEKCPLINIPIPQGYIWGPNQKWQGLRKKDSCRHNSMSHCSAVLHPRLFVLHTFCLHCGCSLCEDRQNFDMGRWGLWSESKYNLEGCLRLISLYIEWWWSGVSCHQRLLLHQQTISSHSDTDTFACTYLNWCSHAKFSVL